LSKALGPSHDYGKLSEHLQQAMNQAQSGDQQGTSKSLQSAMDALSKMSQQQSQQAQLAKMINELQKAGMFISGAELGDSMGKSTGFGQGPGVQKSAGGVGTWPEEGKMPQFAQTWDNTGAHRPDQDSRGHHDRGDPVPPQGTQIMKVGGQLGQGGPMPGIQLQGISIKGQSQVHVEEAFSSAAQEAEQALTKEVVPQAYQNSVKDYFDLK
jgi:hypothetical protein